jgi:hypothetical protein
VETWTITLKSGACSTFDLTEDGDEITVEEDNVLGVSCLVFKRERVKDKGGSKEVVAIRIDEIASRHVSNIRWEEEVKFTPEGQEEKYASRLFRPPARKVRKEV